MILRTNWFVVQKGSCSSTIFHLRVPLKRSNEYIRVCDTSAIAVQFSSWVTNVTKIMSDKSPTRWVVISRGNYTAASLKSRPKRREVSTTYSSTSELKSWQQRSEMKQDKPENHHHRNRN